MPYQSAYIFSTIGFTQSEIYIQIIFLIPIAHRYGKIRPDSDYLSITNYLSSLYVCMAIKYIIVLFVETPRKFITAKLSIRKPGSSSVLIIWLTDRKLCSNKFTWCFHKQNYYTLIICLKTKT